MNDHIEVLRQLLREAVPYLRDAGEPFEDDGSNEPLELSRRIEDALESDAALAAEMRAPSYDALLLIAQSVCGALERAGVTDCDDPGEAIDVLREQYEAKIAALAALSAQAEAQAGGEVAEPPSNEVWPPDGAIWLAPVATDAPADPKLMQYAWGRSTLSSGQMAEAYQCIVSAAQECGQVYRLPLAAPATPPAKVPEVQKVIDGMLRLAPTCESDWESQLREWAAMLAAAPAPGEGV